MRHFTSSNFRGLALRSTALVALLGASTLTATAQVSITEDTTEQILTSTAGDDGGPADVTIDGGATVTIDSARSGIILDSDNALILNGVVTSEDINDVTGVLLEGLEGDENRSFTQSGTISLIENFTAENTDDDLFTEGGVAVGEGRTGILISGASPFQGNIELDEVSTIAVEGNDSFGINLESTPMMTEGLTGNLTTGGQISVIGDNSVGVNLAGNVTGDISNTGNIAVNGIGSEGFVVAGDVDGGFSSSGAISSTGFRISTALGFGGEDQLGREDLDAGDLGLSGSAVRISGDVSEGILFDQVLTRVEVDEEPVLDDEGNETFFVSASSTVSQFGSAPAVLIDGEGSIIDIGLVAEIVDPDAEGFSENLQFGFINEGSINSSGLFDDFDSTAVSISNAVIAGGISNTGTLQTQALLGATDSEFTDGQGVARVLVLGNEAMTAAINNSGVILASAVEATDEIFFDLDNVIPARELLAVGIDIEAGASVDEFVNAGALTATIEGRDGSSIAVRDASGTLRTITNTGAVFALGVSRDPDDEAETNFNTIAFDLSAATDSITLTQAQSDATTATPLIGGDILLGSGDDIVDISAGALVGDIDFGGGSDSLTLSGNSRVVGAVTNTDALTLDISDNSILELRTSETIQVASATVDGTSSFRPVLNGTTGEASTLISNGNISFAEGANVSPILDSVIGSNTNTFTIASADNLIVEDIDSLGAGDTPFLFNSTLSLADDNTLVVTLDLRDPSQSVENGGLGLDQVQAAAFGQIVDGDFQNGAVFDALSSTTALGNAFSNIIGADEFQTAVTGLLPEFAGAAHQFVLANVDGAVGAVGNHLDTTRRSQEKSGGAWIQEFFYFADREKTGQSEQYRGDGFGFAGGIDTAVGPFHAVGLNFGFASTEVEDVIGVDEPLDVRTYQIGTYAGLEKNGFNFDVFGGVGFNEFEQSRRATVGDFTGIAQGEWEGVHANGSLRAGYTLPIGEKFWVRPNASVDYLYLNEYGRTETGTQGFRLRVDGRQTETASATAKLDIGAEFHGRRTWIRPSIRVGYRNEFISDPAVTAFRFQGLQDASGNFFDSELATLRGFDLADEGLILGFTVAAGSEYSSIGFDFDSDIRDGFIRHTGRIVIRLLF